VSQVVDVLAVAIANIQNTHNSIEKNFESEREIWRISHHELETDTNSTTFASGETASKYYYTYSTRTTTTTLL
jgi:hypothetical protein